MATILELVQTAKLFRYEAHLGRRQQPCRAIYVSERLGIWLRDDLPNLGSTWNIEASPAEQLDAKLNIFVSGETLTFDYDLKPIQPIGQGVWELKTEDLRVFGWFPSVDVFIGVVADTAQRIKDIGLYAGYRNEVVLFRKKLDLSEPKFIDGDQPNDVVSNYYFPEPPRSR
jgi:hypothetical protein